MPILLRYISLIFLTLLVIHLILGLYYDDYARQTRLSIVVDKFRKPAPPSLVDITTESLRANATFLVLCRNSDMWSIISSLEQMEKRFNKDYNYPWVFLNDEPFTDSFKAMITNRTNSSVSFGVVPREHWVQPDWIEEDKASEARNKMGQKNIIYGESVSYRNMCRFMAGFFYRHELLQQYKYYWRVEPDVQFLCDIPYDPFLFMQDNQKLYGFTVSILEIGDTIPSLWSATQDFMVNNSQYLSLDNAMEFVSDDSGVSYNLCHYWSNFEIADMDFWRGEAYSKYFEHLESLGGFYYERWGDAPIHSIALSLFANKDQVHWFEDIGYRHKPFQNCPTPGSKWRELKCTCNPSWNMAFKPYSCIPRFQRLSE